MSGEGLGAIHVVYSICERVIWMSRRQVTLLHSLIRNSCQYSLDDLASILKALGFVSLIDAIG